MSVCSAKSQRQPRPPPCGSVRVYGLLHVWVCVCVCVCACVCLCVRAPVHVHVCLCVCLCDHLLGLPPHKFRRNAFFSRHCAQKNEQPQTRWKRARACTRWRAHEASSGASTEAKQRRDVHAQTKKQTSKQTNQHRMVLPVAGLKYWEAQGYSPGTVPGRNGTTTGTEQHYKYSTVLLGTELPAAVCALRSADLVAYSLGTQRVLTWVTRRGTHAPSSAASVRRRWSISSASVAF